MRRPRFLDLLLLVPIVGVVELALHLKQVRNVAPDADWDEAKKKVEEIERPDDLVVFAPSWVGPVAQQHFGDRLASLTRIARSDESRFPRAIEVSIRGQRIEALSSWRLTDERHAGGVDIRVLENPAPIPVLVDLVTRLETGENVDVFRDGEPCIRSKTSAQTGQLGFGTAVPADRYQCSHSGFVGRSVLADLQYVPHRCIYAQPPGNGAQLHITFKGVTLGKSLVGHHAISVEQERGKSGSPVTLIAHVGDAVAGRAVHRDGDGWTGFEFDTRSFEGQTKDVTVDVACNAGGRPYCFELTAR